MRRARKVGVKLAMRDDCDINDDKMVIMMTTTMMMMTTMR